MLRVQEEAPATEVLESGRLEFHRTLETLSTILPAGGNAAQSRVDAFAENLQSVLSHNRPVNLLRSFASSKAS